MNVCLKSIAFGALMLQGCVTYLGPDGEISREAQHNRSPEQHYDYTTIRDLTYSPANWPERLTADVYLPEVEGLRPAVLVVHGGGWRGRDRSDMAGICEQLARQGFVAINISHRFAPAYQFPQQIYDLQQAVRWVRHQAERFRIDPSRIGGYGFSSGAHLVLMLATISEGDPLDQPYGGQSTRLQAVVAGSAPTDLRKFKGGRLVPQFLGSRNDDNPEVFAQASPLLMVTADDPPVFFYHGAQDYLVDISHARAMKSELENVDVPAELYIVHHLGHASLFLFSDEAVVSAVSFLQRHL